MKNIDLGKLEKVELREVWKNEPSDFTPWLAKNENLKLLGKAIGMEDLEVIGTEQNIGSGLFRADIVCQDAADNNSPVLIENQFEKTDHRHLGQLLTYAAGLDAVTIIWVSEEFTEEHRAALDWLNEITDETFNFFGLEIELWKIDASSPAPKFNIASKPNDWTRTIRQTAKGEMTARQQRQLEYWMDFKIYVKEQSKIINPQKAHPHSSIMAAIGCADCRLTASIDIPKKEIKCFLSISGSHAKERFRLLEKDKENIEKEFGEHGEQLKWLELPYNKESQVKISFSDNNPDDMDQWPEQHQILCETLEKFHNVFSERIQALDAGDLLEMDEE